MHINLIHLNQINASCKICMHSGFRVRLLMDFGKIKGKHRHFSSKFLIDGATC